MVRKSQSLVPWGKVKIGVATAARLGGETGKLPKAGAIISFAGGGHGSPTEYGHVAFVEKVYPDGSFLISETNYTAILTIPSVSYQESIVRLLVLPIRRNKKQYANKSLGC